MHTHNSPLVLRATKVIASALAFSFLLIQGFEIAMAASSWNPTLLVNTESFQTIDEGDGTTTIEMRFGQTLRETIQYDRANSRFKFSRGIFVGGSVTATGSIKALGNLSGTSLNVDRNAGFYGTVTVSGATLLRGNTKVRANLSGTSLNIDNSAGIYGNLTASGTIATKGSLTINQDADTNDAVFTFGNNTASQTLKYLNTTQRFQFSKNVSVIGSLSGSSLTVDGQASLYGGLSVSGATVLKSTIRLNNVTYTFPGGDGSASGKVLKTNGAGQLSWSADSTATGNSSGNILALQPDYPSAVFFGSGTTAVSCVGHVGTLTRDFDQTNVENFYRWQSTRSSNQCYWVSARIRVPRNFASWDPHTPIQLRYRSSGGYIDFRLLDTAGAPVTLTGGGNLRNGSWTTATITRSGGTYTADSFMTAYIKMTGSGSATTSNFADVGLLKFNWSTTTP